MLTLNDLHRNNLILFEAISGSRAYGLATEQSDTDIKGIFYLPPEQYYGLQYQAQISNQSNDIVYYELGRFVELLLASNPSALELLASPHDCIRYRSDLLDELKIEWFISQACRLSFAGYALGQIKKARGLNKKIVNPMSEQKKSILDFCYVVEDSRSIPVQAWLKKRGWVQEKVGLCDIAHACQLFGIFYDVDGKYVYQGIVQKDYANNLRLSKIAENDILQGYLSFNQNGYSHYCREYTAYWQWVEERNELRYQNNQAHNHGYDSKNMMHTFRLLYMAKEIAEFGEIRVRRNNREELLEIKRGGEDYEHLLEKAAKLMAEVEDLFSQNPCHLPEQIDSAKAERALINIRSKLYA